MSNQSMKYDDSTQVWLFGEAGLFEGEQVSVSVGEAVFVGRSRVCSFSVVRTKKSKKLGRGALEDHPSYRKISRKHFRVTLISQSIVEIEDLSTNGTSVDGYRVDRIQLTAGVDDLIGKIGFGAGEIIAVRRTSVTDDHSGLTFIGNEGVGQKAPSEDGAVSGDIKR